MTRMSVTQDMLMIDITPHNHVDILQQKLLEDIKTAVESGQISTADLSRKIIFKSLCEGHGAKEITAVIDSLEKQPWFHRGRAVFLHNVFDQMPHDIKQVPWTWYMTNHSNWLQKFLQLEIDWPALVHDCWMLCLMRRPSNQRSRLLRQIMYKFNPDQYRVSYASMIDTPRFDPGSGQHIPILLDGPTPGDQQHQAQDIKFFTCVINLVVETSCQEQGPYAWSSRFITEKTFKCFGWKQLPVWFAYPGMVSDVRSLGFDVFDDIIHHDQYDNVQDPAKRMIAVLDILQNFFHQHAHITPQDFYQQIYHRLQKNYDKLLELDSQRLPYWAQILRKCKHV